ncbi:hypothetical protein L8S64_07300 [Enterobacter bugandensis]|uniref:hypothetical protein n=1 Tax=Enterobacter bugandensis TaxID=881260 RepID=UPI002005430E|nr:hypothetical protein [Enterobacter bugandensis]MCK6643382.1 hypothetical protein [Enterobacter bugandensis]
MITFTKEQLIASAHARIEFAEMMLAGELEPLKERTWSIELELARIALASLEAEAVAQVLSSRAGNDTSTIDKALPEGTTLFTAPPAQEVPEVYNIGDATMRHIFTPAVITDVSDMQAVFDQIETVLAGMWQPAPVSVPDELTREEYKRRFMEDDSFDDTFRGGWKACRAAMLHGADGNSPVTQDGWALVPIEPTEDMIVNGFESEPDESFSDEKEWEAYDAMSGCQQAAHRAKLCWAAMIAAAPKPEV